MNTGPLIFLGILTTFVASWWTMIFAPQLQIGSQQPRMTEGSAAAYPASRPGLAAQGHQAYVANGCAYCHSQQVRQDGYTFDVVFLGTTNQEATAAALKSAKVAENRVAEIVAQASDRNPLPVATNVSAQDASRIQKALADSGATAQTVFIPTGADMGRGWGPRQSVAADYLYEYPVQIGNSRFGPDLANVGARLPDAQWHYRHLYEPRAEVKGSLMPAYRFLFEKRKPGRQPSRDAVKLPAEYAPAGYEIVPTEEARQLVAYLQSLRVQTPLFEAPMTQLPQPAPAGGDTNAPAGTNGPAGTNSAAAGSATSNAPAGNTPQK